MGRSLWRIVVVPLAFVVSSAAALFVLFTLGLERITQVLHGRGAEGDSVRAAFELVMDGRVLASGLSIMPALLLVVVGEVARIRSSLYYIVGAGAAFASVPLLARYGQSGASLLPPNLVWQVFATAGFVGGWVYWLLAGRKA